MQIIKRERVFDGHFKVNQLTLKADDGQQMQREQFAPGHAVAALVYDTVQQHYLLTRQFRPGPEGELLEIAAGMIDHDEAPEAALRRELHEELGYETDQLTLIATIWPSPGTSAETIAVYYAEVSQQTGPGGGVASEQESLEVVTFSRAELEKQLLGDAKTLIAMQWLRLNK
ncbi:MAG: NUDIX hydrolase [Hymenobacter sp.]|nr:MAG: NUDIX hydrolase [Hymenobacter sp.]